MTAQTDPEPQVTLESTMPEVPSTEAPLASIPSTEAPSTFTPIPYEYQHPYMKNYGKPKDPNEPPAPAHLREDLEPHMNGYNSVATRWDLNPGSTKNLLVMIVGAGVSGLLTAMMLDLAKVEYEIIEKEAEVTSKAGGVLTFGAPVLRVFEQLGLLDDVLAVSKPVSGFSYYKQDSTHLGRFDVSTFKERYGYEQINISRPDLIKILLARVPSSKINYNKHVKSLYQCVDFGTIRCRDETLFDGDVILGCDGGYSVVRDYMFRNRVFFKETVHTPDMAPYDPKRFALLGTTEALDVEKYSALKERTTEYRVVLVEGKPYEIWTTSMPGNKIAWYIEGDLVDPKPIPMADYSADDYTPGSTDEVYADVKDIFCPFGGSMGELLDRTPKENVVRTIIEERQFKVQYSERTMVLGDASHKCVPFGGQNVTQSVLDAVSIVELLKDMPNPHTYKQVTKMFETHHKRRCAAVAIAMAGNKHLSKVLNIDGWLGSLGRSFVFKHVPDWVYFKSLDRLNGTRPILSFMPAVEDKGAVKASTYKQVIKADGNATAI